MPNYRRLYIPGGQYFFTVNLKDRSTRLLTENIDILRKVYKDVASKHPFKTIAICILPEHLHCIWDLPDGDTNYPMRWRLIKANFSRALKRKGYTNPIWQRGYWEHHIRGEADLNAHIDYIHYNPIKHEHAATLDDWPYSSWHKYSADEKTALATNRAKWDKMSFGEIS